MHIFDSLLYVSLLTYFFIGNSNSVARLYGTVWIQIKEYITYYEPFHMGTTVFF